MAFVSNAVSSGNTLFLSRSGNLHRRLFPNFVNVIEPSNITVAYIPRRFRYKKKWAINRKPSGPCQLALANFDAFYKPVYGDRWPLIRLSLLSLPKYCAVINKYADPSKVSDKLSNTGVDDFVRNARNLRSKTQQEQGDRSLYTAQAEPDLLNHQSFSGSELSGSKFPDTNLPPQISETSSEENSINQNEEETRNSLDPEVESLYDDLYKDNVDVFVPTVRVLSAKDELMREEVSVSTFQPRDVEVQVQPETPVIPTDLSALVFPSGNVSRFAPARPYNRRLGYYLMDPASVLPALALNVQPTDVVLDLCAAPGGKTVLILQTLDPLQGGYLHCNDNANGRVKRLTEVLNSYFPPDVTNEVRISQLDGTVPHQAIYNKVLVDVPCNADRHVLKDEDNNLFRPIRTKERLALMNLQTKLLISAIKSCIVGGEIVYSTCTLAPAQNDGVIQAAVEKLSETTQIEVVVKDMSQFVSLFKENFNFFDKSKYGQIVIPDLLNNSGPSYFAKLKRIK